jgi:hypothetical protein
MMKVKRFWSFFSFKINYRKRRRFWLSAENAETLVSKISGVFAIPIGVLIFRAHFLKMGSTKIVVSSVRPSVHPPVSYF